MDIQQSQLLAQIQAREAKMTEMKLSYETTYAKEASVLARSRQLLNSLQPIGKVPVEILSMIFLNYLHLSHPPHYDDARGRRRDPLLAVRLTHVCSHWRTAAQGFPALWNQFDLSWPAWTVAFLPLAKSAPLTVIFNTNKRFDSRRFNQRLTPRLFHEFGGRIVCLKISACSKTFQKLGGFFSRITTSFANSEPCQLD